MAKFKRRLAGAKARTKGEAFEQLIGGHLNALGFAYVKIQTGCRLVNTPVGKKAILLRNAFDFIATAHGNTFMFDVKSRSSNTISYSEVNKKDSSFAQQVKELHEFEKNGGFAFFLVGFETLDKTAVFLPSQLAALKKGDSIGLLSSVCDAGHYNMICFQSVYSYFTKDSVET